MPPESDEDGLIGGYGFVGLNVPLGPVTVEGGVGVSYDVNNGLSIGPEYYVCTSTQAFAGAGGWPGGGGPIGGATIPFTTVSVEGMKDLATGNYYTGVSGGVVGTAGAGVIWH